MLSSRHFIGFIRQQKALKICSAFFSADAGTGQSDLKRTNLYDFHVSRGAKMVPFAGFAMPLQYSDSIIVSHNHTRTKAGLFDVGHMLQMRIRGTQRAHLMNKLIVGNVDGLAENQASLSLFTNEQGGILDDLIITRCHPEPFFYIVSNAGCADKIRGHLKTWIEQYQKAGRDVRVEYLDNGLLALQGPSMTKVLQPGLEFDLNSLTFMRGRFASVFGIPDCRVTRCGYTGEDGVEISVPKERTQELAERLLQHEDVKTIGLAARDTLRLEAGLCLYGNDIDETTTPIEAALRWTIGKERMAADSTTPAFLGQERIAEQMASAAKVLRRRVGIVTVEGPPGRSGAKVLSSSGEEIGVITSGCMSPYLRTNIGMAYVQRAHAKVGTDVLVEVRKKRYPGKVAKMPFVPAKYFTG